MPRFQPRKLTEGFIMSLPLDGTGYIVRDTKVTGLMLAVNKTVKTYKVQRDLWRGTRGRRQLVKTVRHTLGSTNDLTLEQARLKAEDVIRQFKLGIDPNAPLADQKAEGWTVDVHFDEYAADLRKRECSERTIEDVLARRDRYLADWKRLPLGEPSRSIVRAKHHELTVERGKVTANHVMRDFRAAYNLALRVIDDPDMLPDKGRVPEYWLKACNVTETHLTLAQRTTMERPHISASTATRHCLVTIVAMPTLPMSYKRRREWLQHSQSTRPFPDSTQPRSDHLLRAASQFDAIDLRGFCAPRSALTEKRQTVALRDEQFGDEHSSCPPATMGPGQRRPGPERCRAVNADPLPSPTSCGAVQSTVRALTLNELRDWRKTEFLIESCRLSRGRSAPTADHVRFDLPSGRQRS